LFRRDSEEVYRSVELDQIPWLRHGFGTRLSPEWPAVSDLATARQIHSDRVLLVESPGPQGEGDALICNRPGVSLGIRTADCLPILIADPRSRAVAAVHAGWRGVVSEIAPKAIQQMRQQFGSKPENLVVAIGPGIGPCCFEVGPEVAVQFASYFPELDLSGRAKVDLVETTCRQLGRYGVTMGQIGTANLCSYCNPGLFESYRRDRDASGRMVAMIGLVEGA
jgi:polyphenol oxidase